MDKLTPLLARVSLGKRESLSRDSPSPSVPVGKENASDALSDATAALGSAIYDSRAWKIKGTAHFQLE